MEADNVIDAGEINDLNADIINLDDFEDDEVNLLTIKFKYTVAYHSLL